MAKDILITPGANDPKIDFTGSGVGAEATTLKVNSDSSLTFGDSGADFLHVGDNVGVGTASPSEKLHVIGNVLATGDVSATTISSPTITNLQASATDADNRLDTAETTISQIEGDINTLEASATDHESRIATLESAPGGTSDHGSLSGLADDDHTQYVLADGTRDITGPITIEGKVTGEDGIKAEDTSLGVYTEFAPNSGSSSYPRGAFKMGKNSSPTTIVNAALTVTPDFGPSDTTTQKPCFLEIRTNPYNSAACQRGIIYQSASRLEIVTSTNNGAVAGGPMAFSTKAIGFSTAALYIANGTERVGILTESPQHALDVKGDAALTNSTTATNLYIHNTYTNATNYERLKIGWTSNIVRIEAEKSGTGSARDLGIYVSGNPKVYVKSNGYVGIDTNNPTSDLQIGTNTSSQPNRWITITGYDAFGIKFPAHGGWSNYRLYAGLNSSFILKNIGTNTVDTNFVIEPNSSRKGSIGVYQGNYFVNGQSFLYFTTHPAWKQVDFITEGSQWASNLVITTRYSNADGAVRRYVFKNTGFFEPSGIKALNSSFTNTFAGPIDCDLDITANSISVSALNATVTGHVASGSVHFTEASIDHGSIAGLGDDDHTQYVLATGARSMNSLSVTGNISVTGTVDGRDIAADGTNLDNHIASGSVHFTEASIDHGSIAGLGDDDHTQYVLATGARSMNSLSVTGNISVTGTVDGRDIAADGIKLDNHVASSTVHFTVGSIDHGSIAGLGDDDHTQYVLATGARSMNSLSVTGNISVTGTVDGRDIAADGTKLDNHVASGSVHFTEASIDHGSIAGLGDDDHTQYLRTDGTRALTGNMSAGSNRITNVADPVNPQDVATAYWGLTSFPLLAQNLLDLPNHATARDNLGLSAMATEADDPNDGNTYGRKNNAWAQIDHGALTGLGDDDHTQYALIDGTRDFSSDLGVAGELSANSLNVADVSATWDKLRLDVVWDHLLPHDQNGNWAANTANGGAAYQQNQGAGGTWIYDPSVNPQAPTIQGVMVASNNNTTATNAGATKYHNNLSTYLSVDTVYYFRVATGHSTDCCIRFGVVNEALGATATPQRGAYVQFDTDVDGNIHFVTADDNVRTDTDTSLAATSLFVQEFAWLAIKVEDGGGGSRAIGLYNVEDGGTLLAKHTTNIPDTGSDSAMRAFIQCIGRGSTYRACYLDTFGVYIPGWCPPSWVH